MKGDRRTNCVFGKPFGHRICRGPRLRSAWKGKGGAEEAKAFVVATNRCSRVTLLEERRTKNMPWPIFLRLLPRRRGGGQILTVATPRQPRSWNTFAICSWRRTKLSGRSNREGSCFSRVEKRGGGKGLQGGMHPKDQVGHYLFDEAIITIHGFCSRVLSEMPWRRNPCSGGTRSGIR